MPALHDNLRPRDGDFAKLSTPSQAGRSTATTILTSDTVLDMADLGEEPEARKILSFTEVRQDASLHAGHLNDFAQLVTVRAALLRALEQHGRLEASDLVQQIFEALGLQPEEFMRSEAQTQTADLRAWEAMINLLHYLALTDLGSVWRLSLPNLEQCGLAKVTYRDLEAISGDETAWKRLPFFEEAPPKAGRRCCATSWTTCARDWSSALTTSNANGCAASSAPALQST